MKKMKLLKFTMHIIGLIIVVFVLQIFLLQTVIANAESDDITGTYYTYSRYDGSKTYYVGDTYYGDELTKDNISMIIKSDGTYDIYTLGTYAYTYIWVRDGNVVSMTDDDSWDYSWDYVYSNGRLTETDTDGWVFVYSKNEEDFIDNSVIYLNGTQTAIAICVMVVVIAGIVLAVYFYRKRHPKVESPNENSPHDDSQQENIIAFTDVNTVNKEVVESANDIITEKNSADHIRYEYGVVNGRKLVVYDDKIEILSVGAWGKFIGKGDKTIPISNITAIRLKSPGLDGGFIQFSVLGGVERQGSFMDVADDDNTIWIKKKSDMELICQIKKFIEERMSQYKH